MIGEGRGSWGCGCQVITGSLTVDCVMCLESTILPLLGVWLSGYNRKSDTGLCNVFGEYHSPFTGGVVVRL